MSIQLYSVYASGYGEGYGVESKHGDYVLYEDHMEEINKVYNLLWKEQEKVIALKKHIMGETE